MEQLEINKGDFAGSYKLRRYPYRKKETLRAWDAADEYLLRFLAGDSNDTPAEAISLDAKTSLLIVNDAFGALSIPLQQYSPVLITDSCLSMLAIAQNESLNSVTENTIKIFDSLYLPENRLETNPDIVLIKIPKNLSLLEDQLYRLRPVLTAGTKIISAAMSKHVHRSTLELFEKIIGPTKTSLARKKARLIFSEYDATLQVAITPYPKIYQLDYKLDDEPIRLLNHASVFSTTRLDIGTRFFLENMPVAQHYQTIVDLGCGNGVLGLLSAIKNPHASLIFTDESAMAIESAIQNFTAVFGESREAEFLQTDCLQGVPEKSVSLVLCNPPFHQNNVVSDTIAWQMFVEAKRALHDKGELWVIGNRHLGYHAKLKKLFGHSETVASNKKFTLLKVTKQ